MAKEPKAGDKVGWDSSGGHSVGKVVKKVTKAHDDQGPQGRREPGQSGVFSLRATRAAWLPIRRARLRRADEAVSQTSPPGVSRGGGSLRSVL